MTEQKVSLSFYSSIVFLYTVKHFNNGNAVLMHSGSFSPMGAVFPLKMTLLYHSYNNIHMDTPISPVSCEPGVDSDPLISLLYWFENGMFKDK